MDILFIAVSVGLAIVISALINSKSKEKYHIKPRISFAQVTVVGRTEESETMQLTASLFEDETAEQHQVKLDKLFALRETRLKYQNDRMQELLKSQQEAYEVAKAEGVIKQPTLVKG